MTPERTAVIERLQQLRDEVVESEPAPSHWHNDVRRTLGEAIALLREPPAETLRTALDDIEQGLIRLDMTISGTHDYGDEARALIRQAFAALKRLPAPPRDSQGETWQPMTNEPHEVRVPDAKDLPEFPAPRASEPPRDEP